MEEDNENLVQWLSVDYLEKVLKLKSENFKDFLGPVQLKGRAGKPKIKVIDLVTNSNKISE
jgi:hypothetical protein